MNIFKNVQPEEIIALLKNFKKVIDWTGTTTISRRINNLCTILRGYALQEFDYMEIKNNVTSNAHLK